MEEHHGAWDDDRIGGSGGDGRFGRGGGIAYGGGMSHFAGVAAVHPMGRVAFGNGFRFGHRFVRNRFAFVGVGAPYGYYNSCYARVWTPWGWSWRYVCY